MSSPEPEPLVRLRRALPVLLCAAAVGAALGGGAAALSPRRYRAVETLVVLEPRMTGGVVSVDFNLTPVRSYVALLSSPSLAQACAVAAGLPKEAAPPKVKVRMPEQTRTLELSAELETPESAAAFVRCVAQRAIAENRSINRALSDGAAALVSASRDEARTAHASLQAELARLRASESLERKRAELRAASEGLLANDQAERTALSRLREAEARGKSLSTTADSRPERRRLSSYLSRGPDERAAAGTDAPGGTPVVREEADPVRDMAEKGRAEAAAEAAAARAALENASRGRAAAAARMAKLEAEIADVEERLNSLVKRLEGAGAAEQELERRLALAPVDASARAFELASLSPAVPPRRPAGPAPLLAGVAGGAAALGLAALLVLSRPE